MSGKRNKLRFTIYYSPFTRKRGQRLILLLRIILSIGLAFLLGRIFFQGLSLIKTLGLAAVMFALAYLFEYTRRKDREE